MLSLTCSRQDRLSEGPAFSVSFKPWAFPLLYDKLLIVRPVRPEKAQGKDETVCESGIAIQEWHFQIAPNA